MPLRRNKVTNVYHSMTFTSPDTSLNCGGEKAVPFRPNSPSYEPWLANDRDHSDSSHYLRNADPWPHGYSPRYLPSLSDHSTIRNACRKSLRQVSLEPILAESLFDLPFTLVDLPAVQAKNGEIGFFFLAFPTGHSQRRSAVAPSGAEAHHQHFCHSGVEVLLLQVAPQ